MSDILNSIDTDKYAAAASADNKQEKPQKKTKETVNTGKLRKQVKAVEKEADKAPVPDKPISGRKRTKMLMKANYEINAAKLGIYIPQVK